MRLRVIQGGFGSAFLHESEFLARYGADNVLVVGSGPCEGLPSAWTPLTLRACLGGALMLKAREFDIRLDPGQVHVSASGSAMTTAAAPREARWLMLQFSPLFVRQHFGTRGERAGLMRFHSSRIDSGDNLRRTLDELGWRARRASEDGSDGGLAARVLDQIWVAQAAIEGGIARCPGRSYAHRLDVWQRLARAREFAETGDPRQVTLARMAGLAHISRSHFVRLFTQVHGVTPHRYAVEQRLRLARQLIAESGDAVADIAQAVGFENRSAFARAFKAHFGMSASSWRAQSRAEAEPQRASAAHPTRTTRNAMMQTAA